MITFIRNPKDISFFIFPTTTTTTYSAHKHIVNLHPRINMSSQHIQELVPNAEIVSKQQALIVNTAAAVGLQNVLQSNLGPTGTLKLLVGGTSTQLKLTKDGCTLLKEMQIQHPVAALIARTATAQDDITGDGTTSTVLLIGEILKQCAVYTTNSNYSTTNASGSNSNTIHPRIITDGLDIARDAALDFLKTKFALDQSNASATTTLPVLQNRELLMSVARTSLATKLDAQLVTKVRFITIIFANSDIFQ
jgi:T-complex protein 1 subunit zeta